MQPAAAPDRDSTLSWIIQATIYRLKAVPRSQRAESYRPPETHLSVSIGRPRSQITVPVWQQLNGITFLTGRSASRQTAVVHTAAGDTDALLPNANTGTGSRFRDASLATRSVELVLLEAAQMAVVPDFRDNFHLEDLDHHHQRGPTLCGVRRCAAA